MLILLLALFVQDKPIDMQALIEAERDRATLEKNAKGNAVQLRELRPMLAAQRKALIGIQIKGEGKVRSITVNGSKTGKGSRGNKNDGAVNVSIEVPDGKLAKVISTKALDPSDPLLAMLKKGDEIRFAGTLTTFTSAITGLSGVQYQLKNKP